MYRRVDYLSIYQNKNFFDETYNKICHKGVKNKKNISENKVTIF